MQKKYNISIQLSFKEKIDVNGENKDANKRFSIEKMENMFLIMNNLDIKSFNTWSNDSIFEYSEEDEKVANYLCEYMNKYDKKLSSFHFVGAVLDSKDISQSKIRHYMDRTLDIFAKCKPDNIVLHPGTFSEGGFKYNKIAYKEAIDNWGVDKTFNIIVENIRYFANKAKIFGIKIAIENLFSGRFFSKIDELKLLVETIDMDNVGYCLDVGHANIDREDIPKVICDMGEKLFETHFHDNDGITDKHLPIGFGNINWYNIIKALDDIGYEGNATFEFFRWPTDNIEDGINYSIKMWEMMEKITYEGYDVTKLG